MEQLWWMADFWGDLFHTAETREWNASKFLLQAYVGVVAPPILTAMDRAETLADPIAVSGLSQEDTQLTRSLSFLLAQVLSGPPLQLMLNVGEQNGLEAWRLLVRYEQAVRGLNRIAAMQAILQFEFSPSFDKLGEDVRAIKGLL